VVFDHVSIGDGSIVGGGSVVTKDVPAGVLAYGNPCKVIKKIDTA
jgi:maltose O-acetyltransferase